MVASACAASFGRMPRAARLGPVRSVRAEDCMRQPLRGGGWCPPGFREPGGRGLRVPSAVCGLVVVAALDRGDESGPHVTGDGDPPPADPGDEDGAVLVLDEHVSRCR